jgi:isopentenyl-diphosphate delta-isomerase
LAVHVNVLEEMVQPEGDHNSCGFLDAIGDLVSAVPVPIVAKETGAGLSRESGVALAERGVAALDVGGAGGTSFALVEAARAKLAGDVRGAHLGVAFARWGIPTAAGVLETAGLGLPTIATGGVRNGLDAAKALALGAQLVGIGKPALTAAMKGLDALIDVLESMLEELRLAMVLCGARTPRDLRSRPPVLSGFTRDWAVQRGLR